MGVKVSYHMAKLRYSYSAHISAPTDCPTFTLLPCSYCRDKGGIKKNNFVNWKKYPAEFQTSRVKNTLQAKQRFVTSKQFVFKKLKPNP